MDNFLKIMEQQNSENKFKKVIGQYTFKFGKYKGLTYDEVYEKSKDYVHFVVTKLDYERNKKLIDYYKQRIEEDYS
jgi:hypothetical protein